MTAALSAAMLRLPFTHRGYHDRAAGRIENSLSAFAAAMAAGYGIELDVQMSADGVAMVFHDDDLDRVTAEHGPLGLRTATELGRVGLAGGAHCIPTFAQALALVAGRVPLLVELKDQSGRMAGTDGRLEAAIAADLAGYHGEVAVMSFNPDTVAELARVAPQVPRGITTSAYDPVDWAPLPAADCDRLRGIPDYGRVDACFISHEVADLGRERVAALKAQGAAVLCWTVRSAAQEAEARRVADNVTFEGYAARLP